MDATPRAAGWYQDPQDDARRRYWDGTRWSTLTQPPTIVPRPTDSAPGSPDNPIGAGSVGLAAALHALTADAYERGPEPVEADPVVRRRGRWRRAEKV